MSPVNKFPGTFLTTNFGLFRYTSWMEAPKTLLKYLGQFIALILVGTGIVLTLSVPVLIIVGLFT
ncbi:MAG: hypothetical protein VYD54_12200 [Bdellovibrionota bacterium]|nr:hypothetical protein [Bdellovibrionota bacterium]